MAKGQYVKGTQVAALDDGSRIERSPDGELWHVQADGSDSRIVTQDEADELSRGDSGGKDTTRDESRS